MIAKLILKLRDTWNSLPHPVQAVIMLFLGAATGVIRHVFQNPNACMTTSCWKGYLASALHAGFLAVLALYVPANLGSLNSGK